MTEGGRWKEDRRRAVCMSEKVGLMLLEILAPLTLSHKAKI